jgi:amino acid transporter
MRRFFSNPTVRGLALVALVAFAIVLFSLEESLATVGGLMRIAFFLAIAFFLFLVWRERRSDIESWSDRARWVFYGAVAIAVLDIGMLIGLSPSGLELIAFVVVLVACGWAIFRVWRDEHTYS